MKELRRFLTERGQDPSGIVEKNELVSQACQGTELVCYGTDDERSRGLRAKILQVALVCIGMSPGSCGLRVIADVAPPHDQLCCR